jgi:hypothetical protein
MGDNKKKPAERPDKEGIKPVEAKPAGPEEGTRLIIKAAKRRREEGD